MKYLMKIIIIVIVFWTMPVLADTTLVRGKAYNVGDTPPATWASGDILMYGNSGVSVEQITGTYDNWDVIFTADVTWLNANLTCGGGTVYTDDLIVGDGSVEDPVTIISTFTSDDVVEGSNNLFSMWNYDSVGLRGYLIPSNPSNDVWTEGYVSTIMVELTERYGGDNFIGFQAPVTVAGDEIYTVCPFPGTPGFLTCDTGGLWSWTDVFADTDDQDAIDVYTNTSSFGGNLSVTDIDVQTALDTLDDISITDDQTMDDTYNEGHTILVDAGEIILNGTTAGSTTNFMTMNFDGNPIWDFLSAGAVLDYIGLTVNEGGYIDDDFRAESDNYTNAIDVDASADTVTFGVPSTYIGDVDTAGTLYIADGSGNYTGIRQDATANDDIYSWFTAQPAIGQVAGFTSSGAGVYKLTWIDQTVDTDTDFEVICMGNSSATTISDLIPTTIAYPSCVPYTGMAKYTGVYVAVWTPSGGTDTVTFTLYVDGVAKDSWTSNAGAANSYGGAVDEALTQGHYVEIRAQVTTLVDALDNIRANSCVINVQIE